MWKAKLVKQNPHESSFNIDLMERENGLSSRPSPHSTINKSLAFIIRKKTCYLVQEHIDYKLAANTSNLEQTTLLRSGDDLKAKSELKIWFLLAKDVVWRTSKIFGGFSSVIIVLLSASSTRAMKKNPRYLHNLLATGQSFTQLLCPESHVPFSNGPSQNHLSTCQIQKNNNNKL